MAIYNVDFVISLRGSVEIEAESEEEAMEIFNNPEEERNPLFNGDGNFPLQWGGEAELFDWNAEDAEEVK